jgi:hypothetical protein
LIHEISLISRTHFLWHCFDDETTGQLMIDFSNDWTVNDRENESFSFDWSYFVVEFWIQPHDMRKVTMESMFMSDEWSFSRRICVTWWSNLVQTNLMDFEEGQLFCWGSPCSLSRHDEGLVACSLQYLNGIFICGSACQEVLNQLQVLGSCCGFHATETGVVSWLVLLYSFR